MTGNTYHSQPHPEDRLNVLFLTPWYPQKSNPVNGVFIREHARAVGLYDNVVVIHLKGHEKIRKAWQMVLETDQEITQGIQTFRFSHKRSAIPKTTYPLYLMSILQAYHELARTRFKPDIIHAHIFHAGIPALLLGRSRKLPVIITEQTSAFPRKLLSKKDIFLAKMVFTHADRVLPVSSALQNSIQSYGIRAKFQIIPNVADTQIFTPSSTPALHGEEFRMLFVGNLVPVKGVPYLLQALKALSGKSSNWVLDLVGDGPERVLYEKIAAESGIHHKAIFHGVKPKTEIAGIMQMADLFVLPSLWDNSPSVIVEAMAVGLPVLSTRTGGIPELVSPETGVLVPPGDSQALARAIQEMMAGGIQRFNREEISKKAQKYSPRSVGGQLHSIYREVLQG